MVTLAFKRRQLGDGPKAKWLKGLSSIIVSKSGGLMPYLRAESNILSFIKGKKGKTSLESETLARYTLI